MEGGTIHRPTCAHMQARMHARMHVARRMGWTLFFLGQNSEDQSEEMDAYSQVSPTKLLLCRGLNSMPQNASCS